MTVHLIGPKARTACCGKLWLAVGPSDLFATKVEQVTCRG